MAHLDGALIAPKGRSYKPARNKKPGTKPGFFVLLARNYFNIDHAIAPRSPSSNTVVAVKLIIMPGPRFLASVM